MATNRNAARTSAMRSIRRSLGVEVDYRSTSPGVPVVTVLALVRRAVGITGEFGQVTEGRDTLSLVRGDLVAHPVGGDEVVIKDGAEERRQVDKVLQDNGDRVVVALRRCGA